MICYTDHTHSPALQSAVRSLDTSRRQGRAVQRQQQQQQRAGRVEPSPLALLSARQGSMTPFGHCEP